MKSIKKILFLILCLTSIFNLLKSEADFPAMNPQEMAKLEEMAKKMLDSMSPEEQEKIMQEAIAMDQHIKSLPEEERIKQLKKIDEGVKFIMSPDFPLDELLKAEPSKKEEVKQQEPVVQEQPMPQEEKVQECKVSQPVYHGSTIKIKDTINNLISKIGALLVKVKAMPRVASEKDIENRWAALQSPLTSLESFLKIVLKKEKLLNALNNSEYASLKSGFELLNNKLERFQIDKKNSKFKVPDTAGLTISYEEDEEDPEFETAQRLLKEIIFIFEDSIKNRNILGLFVDFMQKNAPEELKNNPEIAKSLEAESYKVPASTSSGSTYNNYGGYNNSYSGSYGGSYGPYSYPIVDDSSGASGLNPITPTAQTPSAITNSGKGKAEGDKDKAKKEKEGEQKKPESKKDKPKSSGDEKEIKAKINSFSRTLESVSKSLGNSPIPDTISKIKGTDKEVKEKEATKKRSSDDQTEPTTIDDVKADYDKALKLAKDVNQSLENLSGKTKENYKEVVKEVYQRPEFKLEETYSDYLALSKKLEDDLVKNPEDLAIQKKIEENAGLFDIIKKHKRLRKLSGFKDKEEKEKDLH